MIEALLTLAATAFGLWYLYLKAGDAMRAAWRSVKGWLPQMSVRAPVMSAPRQRFISTETVKNIAPGVEVLTSTMLDDNERTATDGRTDEHRPPHPLECSRVKVDKTRAALIETLVYNGWQVDEIRKVIKGENAAISAEVAAARERLTVPSQTRQPLVVRDMNGLREIAR